jgi:hypothetical protein
MAHFSAGRKVRVTVVAEPSSWQSLKAADRQAQLPAIARHWGRLGFKRDPWAISTSGNTVSRIAHDFRVPVHLAGWGPYASMSRWQVTRPARPIRDQFCPGDRKCPSRPGSERASELRKRWRARRDSNPKPSDP